MLILFSELFTEEFLGGWLATYSSEWWGRVKGCGLGRVGVCVEMPDCLNDLQEEF